MTKLSKERFIIVGCEEEDSDLILKPNLSYWQKAWRKFLENKGAIACIIFIILIIIMAVIGPHLTKYKFDQVQVKSALKNLPPTKEHWFGTDANGRDIFARVWVGARGSLFIGFTVTFINITIGIIYGSICGYFGGLIDDITMRIVEIVMTIPSMLIMILMGIILGPGLLSMVAAMSVAGWCNIARVVRGQIMQVKHQEYILAAEALGANSVRIISKHLISNIIGIAIVTISLEVPNIIITEMTLTFTRLISAGTFMTWGTVGRDLGVALILFPYQVHIPYAIICLTLVCFNIVGDALSDALDPKLS